MDAGRWQQVKELFAGAAELPTAERGAFLRKHCAGADELRAEVDSLLAHADELGGFLSGDSAASTRAHGDELAPGAEVGPFQVLDRIGRGGMGLVYVARQKHPTRLVALKVLRPELVDARAVRRFEGEAEALARLHHPNIAQIYEAGSLPGADGPLPYFAMELVRGLTLDEFVREHAVDRRARLELFAKICDAVQHAHEQGVVHRDLKPGNVLVDERGEPKVVDFGIARVTDVERATTLATATGQIVGTLVYMSPEQLGGEARAVGAHSDVYALGVVLYELLAGRLPRELEGKSLAEVVRSISDSEPLPLSSTDASLRGDLETIVAKALEHDPTRRYASAAALAADVRRHLADRPIAARPASTLYQLAKFARRNRGLVAGVGASFLVLAVGAAATTWQAIRATAQRDRALRAEQLASERADAVQREMDKALAARDFLNNMLTSVRAEERGHDVRVSELLDPASERVGEAFADQPEVASFLHYTISAAWSALGRPDHALRELDRSLELLRPLIDASDRRLLLLESLRASALGGLGKHEEAEELARRTWIEQRASLGEGHDDTLGSLSRLVDALRHLDRLVEAEALADEQLGLHERYDGPDHPKTLAARAQTIEIAFKRGRIAQIEPRAVAALEDAERALGREHQQTLAARQTLVAIWIALSRWQQAVELLRPTIEIQERVLGPDHPQTMHLMNDLAIALKRLGNMREAKVIYETILERQERTLGADHRNALVVKSNLANLLWALGDLEQAERRAREVYTAQLRVLGLAHQNTIASATTLAGVLAFQRRFDDAEPIVREALAVSEEHLGPDHNYSATLRDNLARILIETARADEAVPLLEESLAQRERTLGVSPEIERAQCRESLALALYRSGRCAQSEAEYRRAIEERAALHGAEHCYTRLVAANLAVVLIDERRFEEALESLQAARKACENSSGVQPDRLAQVERDVGRCLIALGRAAEAEPLLVHALEVLRSRRPDADAHVRLTVAALVEAYRALGRPDDAERYAAIGR